MQKLNGIWWTLNQKQIPGTLTITDENDIYLITYEKLFESNIINGFVEGKKITLVGTELDRTDVYFQRASNNEKEYDVINNSKMEYSKYKYTAQMAILGHTYERKGDIRVRDLKLSYTNLDKWANWEVQEPTIKENDENILLELKKPISQKIKTGKFDISVVKPYAVLQREQSMQITNTTLIQVENIGNAYIESVQGIITCIQYLLVLCMGDNINVESISATDMYRKKHKDCI